MRTVRKSLMRVLFAGIALCTVVSTTFADGLPGEYYITQRWRDLLAPYSAATNPALLTEANYVTVRGAWSPSLGNAFVLYEGGVVVPIGLYQSVGFTVLGVSSNEPIIPATFDPSTGTIIEEGAPFYDNHMMFMGTYAINPFNKLSLGVNLNVFRTPNFGEEIWGLGLDLGLTYRVANHSLLGEHIVGINFQNAISPNIFARPEGDDIQLQTQSINAKISWLAKMWDRRIDAGIDFDIKDFTTQVANFAGNAIIDTDGDITNILDGAKKIEFDFSSRIGFWILRMFNVYGHFGTGHVGVSGGVNLPSIFGGRDFQASYQFMSITDDDNAMTHTVYVRSEFGAHREQIYAKKMAHQAQIGPGRLYNQALTMYHNGQYWDAFFIFGRIITEYPDFFRNDYVTYYMGLCQENMDMREIATETFNEALSEYPKSPVVPLSQLGLLRIAYRDVNYVLVEDLYNQINLPTTADTIKAAAAYYYGSVKLNEGQAMAAIQLFSTIPMTHADYPFAQHSIAIAYALENNLSKTLEHLDNVIQFVAVTDEQKEIANRSYLLLGFLYYEGTAGEGQQSLAKAVASLRNIDSDSPYYVEALLGRAWIALKSGQWEDCLSAATELEKQTNDPVLKTEAALMIAYYHMVKKNYTASVQLLTDAEKIITEYTAPADTDLQTEENEYYNDRANYYDIAQKAKELALVNQSSYVLQQIDSLSIAQTTEEEEVRAFGTYKDDFNEMLFFARSKDKVLDDVTYALAKGRELVGTTSSSKSIDKIESIDEEMRLLQEQLEMLQ